MQEIKDQVHLIKERMKTAQSRQKSYADNRRRSIDFKVGDWVYVKVSPMRGVSRFGVKNKLSPRYVGPYEIVEKVGVVPFGIAN